MNCDDIFNKYSFEYWDGHYHFVHDLLAIWPSFSLNLSTQVNTATQSNNGKIVVDHENTDDIIKCCKYLKLPLATIFRAFQICINHIVKQHICVLFYILFFPELVSHSLYFKMWFISSHVYYIHKWVHFSIILHYI